MRFLSLLLLLFTLAIPLGAQEAEAPATEAPTGAIETGSSDQLDADIAIRMREIMAELGGYDDVTVTVNEGILTLRGTTTTAEEAAALAPLATRIEGVVSVRNEVTETTDIVQRLNPALERFQERIDQLVIVLPLAAIALAVFLLIVFIGFRLARARRPWDRIAPNAFIADLYRQIVRLAFFLIGLVVALDILNATALLSTILGAAGLIGLAIGFAVRDTVENFIASIMLSIRQPFRPNDAVEINGDQGKVIRLTSRATILLSFDGNHIRIPNATVFKSRLINFSRNAERRFDFPITVGSDADLDAMRDLITTTVQDLPFVLAEPEVMIWIDGITDGGVAFQVTGWIDQRETSLLRARGEALRQVKLAVLAAGVDIPDTTYRIHLDGLPAALAAAEEAPAVAPAQTAPALTESRAVAEVTPSEDSALEKIVEAERDLEDTQDLLREDVPQE